MKKKKEIKKLCLYCRKEMEKIGDEDFGICQECFKKGRK